MLRLLVGFKPIANGGEDGEGFFREAALGDETAVAFVFLAACQRRNYVVVNSRSPFGLVYLNEADNRVRHSVG
jgi:hypothetical protein